MRGEELQQLGVQERLAPQDSEIAVAVLLGVTDDPIQILKGEPPGRRLDVHPAALAPKLTTGDYRDEEERRKRLAAPQPALVQLHRSDAFEPEIVEELPDDLRVGLRQHAPGQRNQHTVLTRPESRRWRDPAPSRHPGAPSLRGT